MESHHFWAFFIIALIAGAAIALAINNATITSYQIQQQGGGGVQKLLQRLFGPPACHWDDATKGCTGTCPIGLECTLVGPKECSCTQPTPTCHWDDVRRECVGKCPIGQECTLIAPKECGCVTPTPVCHWDKELKRCVGKCPIGQDCELVGPEICSCKPYPCQWRPEFGCSGECPIGQTCYYIAPGNCSCKPHPCHWLEEFGCTGTCPAGKACVLVAPKTCSCETPTPSCEDWICPDDPAQKCVQLETKAGLSCVCYVNGREVNCTPPLPSCEGCICVPIPVLQQLVDLSGLTKPGLGKLMVAQDCHCDPKHPMYNWCVWYCKGGIFGTRTK